jgi:hypothetical protein
VLGRARQEALPRLFDMVAAGQLHLSTQEPSGTRVVVTP